ncbi:MAG: hypothetical protein H6582_01135 [Crocinitomicaceae bacterium]|nr:hypothetical protein [Crocinitomicaceae bacterium]
MNRLYYIFPLLLLTVWLSSCKKESTVTIKAMDYITGEGAVYANLNFEVVEKHTPFQEEKSKVVYTGQLDQNGQASFTLKMNPKRNYVLGIEDPPNLCYGEVQQYYLDHASNNNVTFEFAQCAFSKLIINNANCIDANDKLVLYRSNDLGTIDGTYAWEHNGCVYWETTGGVDGDPAGYSSIPYGNIYYHWEVTKNNITTSHHDTVFYNIGEYKTYQIDY